MKQYSNSRIRTVFSPKGWLRAALLPGYIHAARLLFCPEYRLLQRIFRLHRRHGRRNPGFISYRGRQIAYVDAASMASAWDEIFVNRIYDAGPLPGEPYFLDAGANIGLAALYWTLNYPSSSGVCFEPDPQISRVLRKNLATFAANFQVDEVAIGAKESVGYFQPDGTDSGQIVLSGPSHTTSAVQIKRLPPYLQRSVSLLKIDIEGAEYETIWDIRDSLKSVERVFIECHANLEQPQRYGSLIAILQECGFRCHVHSSRQFPSPFSIPKDLYPQTDVSINVFALRPNS